jgi:hypothetical protein
MTTFTGVAVRFGVKAADGLSMSKKAITDALPRFFKRGAPVHLGHGRVPVGKVISAQVTPTALTVKFEVHDASAASLVNSDDFCSLSVGFAYSMARDVRKGVLHGCDLNEISLVDIPGCPGCNINFPNH